MKILIAVVLVMVAVSPVWAGDSSNESAPSGLSSGLTRCADGSYVNVPDGGQATRAPDGSYVATGPKGYVTRAPDGSYVGDSD